MATPVEVLPKKQGLTWWERIIAGIAAAAVAVLAYLVYTNPPKTDQLLGEKVCTGAADCVVATRVDPTTLVIALVALAGVAGLVALLGVRFNKINAGKDFSLEDTSVSEVTKKEAGEKTEGQVGQVDEQSSRREFAPEEAGAAWDRLPNWARNALREWADESDLITMPLRAAVIESDKESGQGNRPWYVTVRLDDGDTRELRVATGRGGTSTQ